MNAWSTALPDWERRILTGQSLVADLPLFKSEAERALRIFKRLRIPDVIGQPTMAEACGEWLFPIVSAMFGSYDAEIHRRMVQEYFLLVPKKNSKSSAGGAIMLTAVIMNRRPEAEYGLIAPTMKIANIAFKQAMGTIRIDPELSKLFHIQKHLRMITHRRTGATLQIFAADTDVITGGKLVGTMIDETHVFAKKGNAADIFLELRGALTSRPDGFLFQTTTQSKEPPSGVFAEELNLARDVRDGKVDLPLLPILYEYPERVLESGEWKERRFWKVVNPNLGKSVDETFLANELMKAEREGIDKLILFASQHHNVEIGLRLRSDHWTGGKHWEAATDERVTLDYLLEWSEVIVAGVDGGGLDDLYGLGLIGRHKVTKQWMGWARAWAQGEVLEQRKDIVTKLRDFEADGDLIVCADDTPTQDITEIVEILSRVREKGLFPEKYAVGLDPLGVAALVDALSAAGFTDEQHAAIGQGIRLSPAVWGLERKLKDKTFVHGGRRMMAWCIGNARQEQRGNAVMITKQMAGKAKIDPFVAILNAVILMSRNPEAHAGGTMDDYIASLRAPAASAAA